jgi:hypothetical protein
MGNKISLEYYEMLLKKHDWYYLYADRNAYYAGQASQNLIDAAERSLSRQGLGEQSSLIRDRVQRQIKGQQ